MTPALLFPARISTKDVLPAPRLSVR
jgi:hypothetical protein